MTAHWLETTVAIPIVAITIDCRNLNVIEPDAFATVAFGRLTTLTLSSINANILSKHSLRGLHQLTGLYLTDFTAKALLPECLHSVRHTLAELVVLQLMNYDSALRLDTALGQTELPALNRVRVYRNLGDTLAWNTFAGLVNVTHLDMSRCQITALGDGVFDRIAETLRDLNLQLNLLVTLWPGVLDALVLRPWVRVAISNNRWQCDCDACYTKWVMRYARNSGVAGGLCANQPFRDLLVNETEFCAPAAEADEAGQCGSHGLCERPEHAKLEFCVDLEKLQPTEPQSATTPTSEMGVSTTDDPADGVQLQQCLDYDRVPTYEIALRVRQYTLQLFYLSQTTVAVHIESNVIERDLPGLTSGPNLVWFEGSNRTNVESKCVGCTHLHFDDGDSDFYHDHRRPKRDEPRHQQRRVTVIVITVRINISYQFCVMRANETGVAPLNCVPYVNVERSMVMASGDKPPTWLNQADRSVSISMMVLAVVSSLLLGFCLGWIAQHCCRWRRECSKASLTVRGGSAESRKLETSFDTRRQSVCSTQSYAQPNLQLSRFDIVRRKLENRAAENQYYLENMPETVAPRPPSLQSDPETSTTSVAGDEGGIELTENIYADVDVAADGGGCSSTYKRF